MASLSQRPSSYPPLPRQLPQDIGQNAVIDKIRHFLVRIDAGQQGGLGGGAVGAVNA